jgi:F0F1-type ATP synthase alpha subunit
VSRVHAAGADLVLAANAIPALPLTGSPEGRTSWPGDTEKLKAAALDPREAELSSSLALGGAGALQFLETSLRDASSLAPCSVALVEVR